MKIAKDKVVGIHYTLTDDNNNVLDSSQGKAPLSYLHGHGNLIPGLEAELEGKQVNDSLKVSIQPENAYGAYNNELVFAVDRTSFSDPDDIEIGVQVQGQMAEGEPPTLLTVIEVNEDKIVLDGNHPLAGQTLNFDVKVVELREGSAEEISHGHVHGPHGHHH